MKYYNPDNQQNALTPGFYIPGVNIGIDDTRLASMTPITDDQYDSLNGSQGQNGKQIGEVNGKPVLIDIPLPTPEELQVLNQAYKAQLLHEAYVATAPYQAAIDLGVATEEEKSLLTQWKVYQVNVNRVDTTQTNITWPTPPAS